MTLAAINLIEIVNINYALLFNDMFLLENLTGQSSYIKNKTSYNSKKVLQNRKTNMRCY